MNVVMAQISPSTKAVLVSVAVMGSISERFVKFGGARMMKSTAHDEIKETSWLKKLRGAIKTRFIRSSDSGCLGRQGFMAYTYYFSQEERRKKEAAKSEIVHYTGASGPLEKIKDRADACVTELGQKNAETLSDQEKLALRLSQDYISAYSVERKWTSNTSPEQQPFGPERIRNVVEQVCVGTTVKVLAHVNWLAPAKMDCVETQEDVDENGFDQFDALSDSQEHLGTEYCDEEELECKETQEDVDENVFDQFDALSDSQEHLGTEYCDEEGLECKETQEDVDENVFKQFDALYDSQERLKTFDEEAKTSRKEGALGIFEDRLRASMEECNLDHLRVVQKDSVGSIRAANVAVAILNAAFVSGLAASGAAALVVILLPAFLSALAQTYVEINFKNREHIEKKVWDTVWRIVGNTIKNVGAELIFNEVLDLVFKKVVW